MLNGYGTFATDEMDIRKMCKRSDLCVHNSIKYTDILEIR